MFNQRHFSEMHNMSRAFAKATQQPGPVERTPAESIVLRIESHRRLATIFIVIALVSGFVFLLFLADGNSAKWGALAVGGFFTIGAFASLVIKNIWEARRLHRGNSGAL